MIQPPAMYFRWDGHVMIPHSAEFAQRHFKTGGRYRMVVEDERSQLSHDHEFAYLKDLWDTLPESMAGEFKNANHLRKYALIKAGYCDVKKTVCESHAEAIRFAAFLEEMEEYSVVTIAGPVVTKYTAWSQAKHAMPAKLFQESKTAVLEIVEDMIGIRKQA